VRLPGGGDFVATLPNHSSEVDKAKRILLFLINCAAVTLKPQALYPNQGTTINMTDSAGTVISRGMITGSRGVSCGDCGL
jgi:hypothetical protein